MACSLPFHNGNAEERGISSPERESGPQAGQAQSRSMRCANYPQHSWRPQADEDYEALVAQASCKTLACPYTQDQLRQRQREGIYDSHQRPTTWQPSKHQLSKVWIQEALHEYHAEVRFVQNLWFDPRVHWFQVGYHTTSHHLATRFIIISPELSPNESGQCPRDGSMNESSRFSFIFETVALVGQWHCHSWGMLRLATESAGNLLALVVHCSRSRVKIGTNAEQQDLVRRWATMEVEEFSGRDVFHSVDGFLQNSTAPDSPPHGSMGSMDCPIFLRLLSPIQRFHEGTGTYSTDLMSHSEVSASSFNNAMITKKRFGKTPGLRVLVIENEASKRVR